MTEEEKIWLRLHLTPGLGRRSLTRLMEVFGPAPAIIEAGPEAWAKVAGIRKEVVLAVPDRTDSRLHKTCLAMDRLGVGILALTDERYPPLLRNIHDPPALLYLRGSLPPQDSFAVVGARRASEAGLRLTTEVCSELAAQNLTIVSGLARGIDTAAHQGAMEGGGWTVAVLGCGIDRIYPPENARLLHRILEKGAVLSEYPPGTLPLSGHFPGRNRIISGLSLGVMVVEAAEESGSLITAEFALEQGREVFAVPGAVYAPTSQGVNRLIKDGARVVTEARDILEVLRPGAPCGEVRRQEEGFAATLSGTTLAIYELLGKEPLHIDELAQKSGLTPMELSIILLHLELRGGIRQLPGMRYFRSSRT